MSRNANTSAKTSEARPTPTHVFHVTFGDVKDWPKARPSVERKVALPKGANVEQELRSWSERFVRPIAKLSFAELPTQEAPAPQEPRKAQPTPSGLRSNNHRADCTCPFCQRAYGVSPEAPAKQEEPTVVRAISEADERLLDWARTYAEARGHVGSRAAEKVANKAHGRVA